jgi:DNA-binding LacI/PurR family transcriptional regulator
MEDIAKLAGVSVSTVSRALARSPRVNAKTRERVEEIARSLNYTINIGASNLRLQRNRTIAVVLPLDSATGQRATDAFFMSMLGNLADALTAHGYDMLLSRIDADRLLLAGDLAASGRAGGIIMIGQWHHHDQLNELGARGVPIVVWGARMPEQKYCTVGSDNVAGGMLATEHLISNGCRRIAFLGDTDLPEIWRRHEGYGNALAKHGMAPVADLTRQVTFAEGGARAAVSALIDQHVKFDGIFASADVLAMEAISALRERGLRVPDNVAVVGYDDVVLARYSHPALTTIRQPITEGAEALVEALLKIIEGKRPRSQILPTELIVRESSVRNGAG